MSINRFKTNKNPTAKFIEINSGWDQKFDLNEMQKKFLILNLFLQLNNTLLHNAYLTDKNGKYEIISIMRMIDGFGILFKAENGIITAGQYFFIENQNILNTDPAKFKMSEFQNLNDSKDNPKEIYEHRPDNSIILQNTGSIIFTSQEIQTLQSLKESAIRQKLIANEKARIAILKEVEDKYPAPRKFDIHGVAPKQRLTLGYSPRFTKSDIISAIKNKSAIEKKSVSSEDLVSSQDIPQNTKP